jgi:cell division protein FtsL
MVKKLQLMSPETQMEIIILILVLMLLVLSGIILYDHTIIAEQTRQIMQLNAEIDVVKKANLSHMAAIVKLSQLVGPEVSF